MSAEGAQGHCHGRQQGANGKERLQAAFLFFGVRCGRFFP